MLSSNSGRPRYSSQSPPLIPPQLCARKTCFRRLIPTEPFSGRAVPDGSDGWLPSADTIFLGSPLKKPYTKEVVAARQHHLTIPDSHYQMWAVQDLSRWQHQLPSPSHTNIYTGRPRWRAGKE